MIEGSYCNLFNCIPNRRRGDSAIWAFLIAVMVLVTPGPAVTAATPICPESLATASAAKTVVTYIFSIDN